MNLLKGLLYKKGLRVEPGTFGVKPVFWGYARSLVENYEEQKQEKRAERRE
jgi:hypothetical protein